MTQHLITATRRIEWDAAHRVLRHESKCASLHGHRYAAELTCVADRGLDDVGRVIDFGVVKSIVGTWVDDNWDHTTLVNPNDTELLGWCRAQQEQGKRAPWVMEGEPTAENIAATLMGVANSLLLGTGVRVVEVKVWETPNCYAVAKERA